MPLLSVIKSLLPRLSKSSVLEDLRITRHEFATVVAPSYEQAESYFKSEKFKLDALKQLETIFYRNFDARRGVSKPNILIEVAAALPTLQTNLEFIESQLDVSLESDVIRDGLTIRKTMLLSAADDFGFISRFSLALLDRVCADYIAINTHTTRSIRTGAERPPIKEREMESQIGAFAIALQRHSLKPAEYIKQLNAIPEAVVNEVNYEAVRAVHSEPTTLGDFSMAKGFIQSPIYHIRMQVAEWQANRYKLFQDRKRTVELRLLLLRGLRTDTPDPAVEREIAYLEERVETLEYKMDKLAS